MWMILRFVNISLNCFKTILIFNTANEDLENNKQVTKGKVTISTIHGSKGLKWLVVFILSCVKGIIPSIFSRDDDENGEEDNNDDKRNAKRGKDGNDSNNSSNTLNGITKRPRNTEVNLDEERRMFFIAHTRVNLLLYLSSIDENEGKTHVRWTRPFLNFKLTCYIS